MATDPVELRANATREALTRARDAIPRVVELDPELGARLNVLFDREASAIQRGLDNRSSDEETAKLIRRGADFIEETIAFIGGAAARSLGLDGGYTALALAWLDALSDKVELPRVGVVVPAATDDTSMLTRVVRLRIPSDGIWGLPVAVHEYGHFVASVLTRREARRDMQTTIVPIEERTYGAASDADLPKLYWHGHELFADAFAAVTVGPAYTRYCIHHRFDPGEAQKATADHPEPARRIRVQLTAMRRIATDDQRLYITAELDALRASWDGAVEAAGKDPAVRPHENLDRLEEDLLRLLDDDKLVELRYSEHVGARRLAEAPLAQAEGAESVAEALNAAWVRRLRNGTNESVDTIAAACERLVGQVLGRV
jgi:hypothetical protein